LAPRLYFLATAVAFATSAPYGPAKVIAHLENPAVHESSGIAASRRWPGVFWTHNDSGDRARLFAFDREGRDRGSFTVSGATNIDWEDIALGPGPRPSGWHLYIGEIGGNKRDATEVVIYRIPEPRPRHGGAAGTEPAFPIHLRYPDHAHDAEALLVHPVTGDIYIVTKAFADDRETLVFKAPAPHTTAARTMEKVGRIRFSNESEFTLMLGRVTGGDISPDGRRVVLCDYFRAYETVIPAGRPFDDIWAQELTPIELAPRRQGEAICYRHDGRALLATSEGSPCPLQEAERSAQ
jgi:hypothetical protein